jgi:hypothetical protein
VSTFNIPVGTPMSGDGSVFVNPFDGAIYFTTDATNSIGRLAGLGPVFTYSLLSIPGITSPKGVGAGDDGALFISTGGVMKVARLGVGGGWAVDPTHPFNNLPAAPRFGVLRSRTNFDPAQHTGPAWDNILADDLLPLGIDVPDCISDVDSDNDTDGADLARVLGAWGSNDMNNDLNADGIVDGADLAIVLGGWGPCP